MTEPQTQEIQGTEDNPEARHATAQPQEPAIPKSRFDEVNRRMKEAEKKAQELETANQQRDEERAQSQGEFQQLAEKRQKKIDTLTEEVTDLKSQIVRDKRYRSFVGAASGIVLSEAYDDAFSMITEDEWSSANEDDVNSVRMLAQSIAERKSYLAAGPRGSGSGGSARPVFGAVAANGGSSQGDGRKPFQFKSTQKHWK